MSEAILFLTVSTILIYGISMYMHFRAVKQSGAGSPHRKICDAEQGKAAARVADQEAEKIILRGFRAIKANPRSNELLTSKGIYTGVRIRNDLSGQTNRVVEMRKYKGEKR